MNDQFTYAELGVLLIAVGTVMSINGLCADAAMDGNSDRHLVTIMMKHGIDGKRAEQLLALDLSVAINYIRE